MKMCPGIRKTTNLIRVLFCKYFEFGLIRLKSNITFHPIVKYAMSTIDLFKYFQVLTRYLTNNRILYTKCYIILVYDKIPVFDIVQIIKLCIQSLS